MTKKKNNDNFFSGWNKIISEAKTKVTRYYMKDDINRETPYIFDGWRKNFLTGEKLVAFYTKKNYDEELDCYSSFVLPYDKFIELFDGVEVEI